MSLIIKAARFALNAHREQKRKYTGEPYIMHPARVAGRVTMLSNTTEAMIAAAWLHDVVEDCGVKDEQILEEFGLPVADLVVQLTKPSKQFPHLLRTERERIDCEYLATVPDGAKRIKMCDRIDNLNDMAGAKSKFKILYVEESRRLVASIGGADSELAAELLAGCERLLLTVSP